MRDTLAAPRKRQEQANQNEPAYTRLLINTLESVRDLTWGLIAFYTPTGRSTAEMVLHKTMVPPGRAEWDVRFTQTWTRG